MKVSMLSLFSGKINVMDLPVTQAELDNWKTSGAHVQNAFPHLDPNQREFLLTGATPEEWLDFLGPEPEE